MCRRIFSFFLLYLANHVTILQIGGGGPIGPGCVETGKREVKGKGVSVHVGRVTFRPQSHG